MTHLLIAHPKFPSNSSGILKKSAIESRKLPNILNVDGTGLMTIKDTTNRGIVLHFFKGKPDVTAILDVSQARESCYGSRI